MVKTQFHVVVKCVRTDNAMELRSSNVGKKYFQDQGILHQMYTTYNP